MAVGRCFICQTRTEILDEHHVIPQFAGGEAGPTVNLCSRCHSGIHRQALNLVARKAQRKAYFTDEQMTRAAPLVEFIVRSLIAVRENRSATQKVKIVMEVDAQLLIVLHMLKADAGHSNLSVFCANVLREYAKARL